jgi:diguanylate cyclase (GGDEF)-like protein
MDVPGHLDGMTRAVSALAPTRGFAPAAAWRDGRTAIVSGGHAGGLLVAVIVASAHFLLAQFVLRVNDPLQVGMNFWPSAGLTVGALLLLPTRRWLWALPAIAIAEAASNAIHGHPPSVNVWFVGSNTIEPLIGATLLLRFSRYRGDLVPVRGLLEFIAFAVICAPIVGGGIGSVGTTVAGADFLDSWPRFMVGDALGVLVVAPVLLSVRRWRNDRPIRTAIAPTVVTVVVSAFALHAWPGGWDTVTPYLVIPPLTWAALRSGVRGASWSVLAMGQVANLAVAAGVEPFVATSDTGYTVTLLQAYLGIVACTVLLLASATSELSDRDEVEAKLRRQALHDPLTGLPNRFYLAERLEADVRRVREEGVPLAMCVVDLDDFKAVNDRHGHLLGDELLVAAAQRLQRTVRDTDFIARVGGDEFVVLITEATDQAIEAVTGRIVERLSAPVELLGQRVQTTVSIGVAIAEPDAELDDLFRDADAAMYRAKAAGRDRVVWHGDEG